MKDYKSVPEYLAAKALNNDWKEIKEKTKQTPEFQKNSF